MSAEDLRKSQAASDQARNLMDSGDYARAVDAYKEAAEYMLRFAKEETGQRQAAAYQIVEQLIHKGMHAKEEAVRQQEKRCDPPQTVSFSPAADQPCAAVPPDQTSFFSSLSAMSSPTSVNR